MRPFARPFKCGSSELAKRLFRPLASARYGPCTRRSSCFQARTPMPK
jgi:hypothetical protein